MSKFINEAKKKKDGGGDNDEGDLKDYMEIIKI